MPRLRIRVRGTVQGVGFRPFIARLAREVCLGGWVLNDREGVLIEVQGPAVQIERFQEVLRLRSPAASELREIEVESCEDEPGEEPDGFSIRPSPGNGESVQLSIPPDLATCPECLRELADPADRRHGYPFINCTHCGPRYSILEALPYDRERSSMKGFPLCPDCTREYADQRDRRYHAEPVACPACGPSLCLHDAHGQLQAHRTEALERAAALLRDGSVVAVKGIGGYHLMADASSSGAVSRLRLRKHRLEKPLAVMFPDEEVLQRHCHADTESLRLLRSSAAPILLLRRRPDSMLAPELAPGNPFLGALLPYSPLHKLLLQACGRPLVATSANLSEEPLCHAEPEVFGRLNGIADAFLVHDRPIVRPIDDSVLREDGSGAYIILRRARGYAPTPMPLPSWLPPGPPLLCLGGQMKNTVAVVNERHAILSPHLGDLSTARSVEAFHQGIDLLCQVLDEQPAQLACDLHPDYGSTVHARRLGRPLLQVQHHAAHLFSCLGEQEQLPERSLGFCWDGTGLGLDGGIWGGEFLLYDHQARNLQRIGRLRPFRLPGGDQAAREPRRSALALVRAVGLPVDPRRELGFAAAELSVLDNLCLRGGTLAPECTSVGRLFDGVAALLGLRRRSSFEGQAAMELEFAAIAADFDPELSPLSFSIRERQGLLELDWEPALTELLDLRGTRKSGELAFAFHAGLAKGAAELAKLAGAPAVALSGGCFQNALLLRLCRQFLETQDLAVLTHKRLPPNDGSLCFGQAVAVRLGLGITAPPGRPAQ
jgi:hydrogenase maturation protein HypF